MLKKTEKKRQWWKLIIWGIFFIITYFIFDYFKYQSNINTPISQNQSFEDFIINDGDSPSFIGEKLEKSLFISSATSFVRYLKEVNKDNKIYSGKYRISASMNIPEIIEVLTTPQKYTKVTIPEGLTIKEIDELLFKKKIFKENEFLNCIKKTCNFDDYKFLPKDRNLYEGYFFPATYELKENQINIQDLANKMLNAFNKKINKLKLDSHKKYSLQEILTMASIIEKESSSHKGQESKTISGILWNRIEKEIPLGADATTRYALQNKSKALTKTDLQHAGPFNTRKTKGLPPHAISSPGEASLIASMNPKETSYLFYLHDKTKQIHYAITNSQHEQNKKKYCGGSCE
jgi:UPF0755 protein